MSNPEESVRVQGWKSEHDRLPKERVPGRWTWWGHERQWGVHVAGPTGAGCWWKKSKPGWQRVPPKAHARLEEHGRLIETERRGEHVRRWGRATPAGQQRQSRKVREGCRPEDHACRVCRQLGPIGRRWRRVHSSPRNKKITREFEIWKRLTYLNIIG